jgi:hypothetical protein
LALYRLYYNRAITLFYLKDYEEASSDAREAIHLLPDSYEAYSVLGRSLFYLQDYEGAIAAITEGLSTINPEDEQQKQNVNFDKAYLARAKSELSSLLMTRTAEEEQEEAAVHPSPPRSILSSSSDTKDASTTITSYYSPSRIPKLKPPRFVPREEAMASAPNIPSMPKSWPCQTLIGDNTVIVGPERYVTFYEGVMGIKLNRGSDGFVRIISTNILPPTDPHLAKREGIIATGDVLREAAGVDLRRPITNAMWYVFFF